MTDGKILIIDDERDIVERIRQYLQLSLSSYEILEAYGGADGLRIASDQRPDLVLLDIKMDDVTGFEVIRELKKRKISTKVVVITAHSNHQLIIECVNSGVTNINEKPFDLKDLTNAIKRELEIGITLDKYASYDEIMEANVTLTHENNRISELNNRLEYEKKKLSLRDSWRLAIIRLVYLLVVSLVSIIFYSMEMLTANYAITVFTGGIVLLLLTPIERMKRFSTRRKKTKAAIEMYPDDDSSAN